MTPTDLKTILDAATPGHDGSPECNRCHQMFSVPLLMEPTPLCHDCAHAIVGDLLPAFLRLWEAAEKVSDYIEDDGTGPYFPNPSTAHALLFSMHAALSELREMKGTP